MSAYAALVSLGHIIKQLQHHPRPPISLHELQVESLTEKFTFLQDFLEKNSINGGSEESEALESRIVDAAHAAEDMIESLIVDHIIARSTITDHGRQISGSPEFDQGSGSPEFDQGSGSPEFLQRFGSTEFYQRFGSPEFLQRFGSPEFDQGSGSTEFYQKDSDSREFDQVSGSTEFYQGLQKVIEDMDFIKKDAMEIKAKMGDQDELQHEYSMFAGSSRSPSVVKNIMVGLDDVLIEIMDKLTGQQSSRQIIPIVGMGGIGKTTLARNIYVKMLGERHFDILAWATISQEYDAKKILLEVLFCLKTTWLREHLNQMSEDRLGEILYKRLSGRRYLVVMDDIWSTEAWEKVEKFFPDKNNGSRLIITTRLSNLAFQLTGSHGFELSFLDEDKSWNLLCISVFGQVGCPPELEKIGKKIAQNCKGLPLSIVVIGRLLAKSEKTQEYWEYVAENLNSIVNLDDNERCLKILQKSYNWLPVHLKPCFLYMGVFREDNVILVSWLINQWVAEGFVKPISDISLEEVAEYYLKELIDRNLILIDWWSFNGKIKFCSIHDLIRDLCIREAHKDNFLCITKQHNLDIPQGIETQRRIVVHPGTRPQVIDALQSASLARSLICDIHFQGDVQLHNFRLLRVLRAWKAIDQKSYFEKRDKKYRVKAIFQLVNSRFLAIKADRSWLGIVPSSIHLLWNLQTLIVNGEGLTAPPEIWKMSQLRHVKFDELYLPNPPSGHIYGEDIILRNLQTLLRIRDFKCTEEVVNKIPNIKKMKILYWGIDEGWSRYRLNNLAHLETLESLGCYFDPYGMQTVNELLQNLTFPHSLRELTLFGGGLDWEFITTKIGSLPLLEILKLKVNSFKGSTWETVDDKFQNLKYLQIRSCRELEYWNTDSTHFPRLEQLVLIDVVMLKEIPSAIGHIHTLQLIRLEFCGKSAVMSAKRIQEEQEELGNVDLEIRVNESREV